MTGARSAADAPRPSSGRTGSCAYVSRRRPPDPAAIRGVPHGAGTPIDQPDVGGVLRFATEVPDAGCDRRCRSASSDPAAGPAPGMFHRLYARVLKFVEAVGDAPEVHERGP